MKNLFRSAGLFFVLFSSFAFAGPAIVCVSGAYNNSGALANLSGAEPLVAVLNGKSLSLYSIDPSDIPHNRNERFDLSKGKRFGKSTVVTNPNSSTVNANWTVEANGDSKTTAWVGINLTSLSGAIQTNSTGPGYQGSMTESISCIPAALK